MEERTKIELDSDSTALLIVDMQVEGCERHGPGVKPVIGNIRRLLDRFRATQRENYPCAISQDKGPSRVHRFRAALWIADRQPGS